MCSSGVSSSIWNSCWKTSDLHYFQSSELSMVSCVHSDTFGNWYNVLKMDSSIFGLKPNYTHLQKLKKNNINKWAIKWIFLHFLLNMQARCSWLHSSSCLIRILSSLRSEMVIVKRLLQAVSPSPNFMQFLLYYIVLEILKMMNYTGAIYKAFA